MVDIRNRVSLLLTAFACPLLMEMRWVKRKRSRNSRLCLRCSEKFNLIRARILGLQLAIVWERRGNIHPGYIILALADIYSVMWCSRKVVILLKDRAPKECASDLKDFVLPPKSLHFSWMGKYAWIFCKCVH